MLCAGFGNGIYFWIAARVSREGIPVKRFLTPFDMADMFRTYRELARTRGWSSWPTYAFWFAGGTAIVLFLVGFPLCK